MAILEFSEVDFPSWPGFAGLTDFERARLGPGSRWVSADRGRMRHFVLDEGGTTLGRVSAFVNAGMQDQPEPTGVIGCLAFHDEGWSEEGARLIPLVDASLAWLRGEGMRRVRGPIDFSTWHTYRSVTDDWGYPPVLGENAYDARYGRLLTRWMKPSGSYCSSLITDVEGGKKAAKIMRIDEAETRFGVRLEHLDRDGVLNQLELFYALASRIFPQDFAFSPIALDEFRELMTPVARSAPEFHCMLARDPEERPIGLVYGFLNPASPKKTGVIKSLGVVPEWQGKKVAYLLTYRYHLRLLEEGYVNFVHAIMKEDNFSRVMSMHFSSKIRGFALYEGSL